MNNKNMSRIEITQLVENEILKNEVLKKKTFFSNKELFEILNKKKQFVNNSELKSYIAKALYNLKQQKKINKLMIEEKEINSSWSFNKININKISTEEKLNLVFGNNWTYFGQTLLHKYKLTSQIIVNHGILVNSISKENRNKMKLLNIDINQIIHRTLKSELNTFDIKNKYVFLKENTRDRLKYFSFANAFFELTIDYIENGLEKNYIKNFLSAISNENIEINKVIYYFEQMNLLNEQSRKVSEFKKVMLNEYAKERQI